MAGGWRNPHLADSEYPIAHGRCDQRDSSDMAGPLPEGGEALSEGDRQYTWLGPGHFGGLVSGPYTDGKRTIWSNGRETIVKLDYDSLEVLATYELGQEGFATERSHVDDWEAGIRGLDELVGDEAVIHAAELATRYLTGLDGVYGLLDDSHTLFLGRKTCVVAYSEVDPSDRASAIIERGRWLKPARIEGAFVGLNMTPDGRLVLSTDHGWLVSLARDFSSYEVIQLPRAAEEAAAHCSLMEAERGNTGYGWVRTSLCCDAEGGVYVSSVDHTHRVLWTGTRFSLESDDGAWVARYRNGTGCGSGTTPSLMGDDPTGDRFVVIGDGDDVVNITLFWRDAIPDDWNCLPDAPSRRIAGLGAAHMGEAAFGNVQTEQSVTVAGYGAMVVNNEPRCLPDWLPQRGSRLLSFFLGHDDRFTPFGMHKYEWDPLKRQFREAWVASDVSSPNSVPFVSERSSTVYTCGTRSGRWTIEGVNWLTGESRGYWELGGSQFNALGGGVHLDEEGRILFGNIFGKTRVLRGPIQETDRPE